MTDQATKALRDHVKGLIIKVCDVQGVTPDQVADDAILFDKTGPLGLTSLDAVEIAVVLEHEFEVEFKNTSSIRECFRSIATLSDHLAQNTDPEGLKRVLGLPAV
jgi:acyl carrier protein